MMGIVYFLALENTDGYVKIGWSSDMRKRFPHGRATDNPYPLKILGTYPGSRQHEKQLHAHLKDHRIGGEWFYPSAEVFACMKTIASDGIEALLARWGETSSQ